jgi:DNA replication regulator DPB11
LTKKVTQLIVYQPSGRKYEFALHWGVKVVGEEWLHESILRGMRLEETLFNPNFPPIERGQGAWRKTLPEDYVAQLKRLRDDAVPSNAPRPSKLKRTISNRHKSDVQAMWADMKAVATSNRHSQQRDEWGEGQDSHGTGATSSTMPAGSDSIAKDALGLRAAGPQNIFTGLTVFAHGFGQTKVGTHSRL